MEAVGWERSSQDRYQDSKAMLLSTYKSFGWHCSEHPMIVLLVASGPQN